MPRREARIRCSRNDDQDWTSLPMDAQWLYDTLLTQPALSHAGVLTIPRREWSNLCSDDDAADRIARARKVLEDRRYIVVDDNTDELLVRTVLRGDVVKGPPGTFCSGMNAVSAVVSRRLRGVLRDELLRLDEAEIRGRKKASNGEEPIVAFHRALAACGASPGGPSGGDALPDPQTSLWPVSEGEHAMPHGTADAMRHAMPHGTASHAMPHSMSHAPVVVEVASPSFTSVVDQLGGRARVHTRVADQPRRPADGGGAGPPPSNSSDDRPSERCKRHREVDDPPDCRSCKRARERAEAWDLEHHRAQVVSSLSVRRCPMCDADGWLHEVGRATPVSPPAACDHATDHHEQVRRAREAS